MNILFLLEELPFVACPEPVMAAVLWMSLIIFCDSVVPKLWQNFHSQSVIEMRGDKPGRIERRLDSYCFLSYL